MGWLSFQLGSISSLDLLLWVYSTLVKATQAFGRSDGFVRVRCSGVGQRAERRTLRQLAVEHIGHCANDQGVHHQGGGEGDELGRNLGGHVSLLGWQSSRCFGDLVI